MLSARMLLFNSKGCWTNGSSRFSLDLTLFVGNNGTIDVVDMLPVTMSSSTAEPSKRVVWPLLCATWSVIVVCLSLNGTAEAVTNVSGTMRSAIVAVALLRSHG